MTRLLSAFLLALCCAGGAFAQAYPTKPVRLFVGFPPGGGSDALARLVGAALTEKFGQQILVDNKPGANTIVATEYVKSQPADGYTLLFVSASFSINPSLYKLTYDIEKDFNAVSIVAIVPLLMIVNNNLPVKSVKELIAMAKAQPGKLTYASFGSGSAAHLGGELFLSMTGTDMIHVPYKGSAPAVIDLVGGHLQLMFDPLQSVIAQVQAGKLRALAVSSAARASVLPNVPTVAESGVPNFETTAWWGVFAPANLPPALATSLAAESEKIVRSSAFGEKLVPLGVSPTARTLQAFAEFQKAELAKWGKAVRDSGATVD